MEHIFAFYAKACLRTNKSHTERRSSYFETCDCVLCARLVSIVWIVSICREVTVTLVQMSRTMTVFIVREGAAVLYRTIDDIGRNMRDVRKLMNGRVVQMESGSSIDQSDREYLKF